MYNDSIIGFAKDDDFDPYEPYPGPEEFGRRLMARYIKNVPDLVYGITTISIDDK